MTSLGTSADAGAVAAAEAHPRRTGAPGRVRPLPTGWVAPALALVTLLVVAAIASGDRGLALVAGAAAAAALLGVILLWPDVATIVVLVLVYSNAPVIGAQTGALPYLVAALVPALLVVPLAERVVLGRERIVLPPTLPFVVAFLLVEIVSTLVSRDPNAASAELGRVVSEGVILYLLVVNTVRTLPLLRAAMVALVTVGAVLGLLTVIQQANGFENTFLGFAQVQGPFAVGTGPAEELQPRAAGPIGEKNFYAQMLLALIPLVLVFVRTARIPLRIAAAGAGLLIAAGVALTFSRGAAVGAVLLLPVMVALRMIGPRGVLTAILAGVLVLIAVPNYAVRLASLEGITGALNPSAATDPVISQRANDVLAAGAAFLDHPILGVGPGLFPTYYRQYAHDVGGLAGELDYAAHSLYAEVASETGILGLVTFGGLIGATIVLLLRARRLAAGRPDLVAVADGFLLVVVVYLGTGLALHISYQRYLWMFLALAAAAAGILADEARAGGPERRGREVRRPLRRRSNLARLTAPLHP